jgi:hypothetical protein
MKCPDEWSWRSTKIAGDLARRLLGAFVLAGFILGLIGTGTEAAAWTLGTPVVFYWGQNTAYPNSSVSQTLQYDFDGAYNLIWSDEDLTMTGAQALGLRVLYNDPVFYQFQSNDLANPPNKSIIDSRIAHLNSTVTSNGVTVPQFPAFFGYFLGDEYPATNFPAMGELAAYLKTADPNHASYANISGLPGEITSESQMTNYQSYLSQFLTIVHPSFFSYDYYQLINNFSGTTYIGPDDLNGYLMNLGMVSTGAHQSGIPFMNVVQAFRYNAGVRTPNSNELQYLVYSTLAYGAQGICYYTWDNGDYTAPLPGQPYYDGDTNVGAIEPLSWNPLIPSDVYTELTPLNQQFVAIATQLQSLNWIGTYLLGYSNSSRSGFLGPPGTAPPPTNAPFRISGLTNNLKYVSYAPIKGVLLGIFGSTSNSLTNAQYALVQNVDYTTNHIYVVNGPGVLAVFNPSTGTWTTSNSTQISLNLPAGGGALICVLPVIAASRSGANLILTWQGGGVLQSTTNLSAAYTNVPGSRSPYTNAPTVAQRYFRVQQ